jgi:hypothetical protein
LTYEVYKGFDTDEFTTKDEENKMLGIEKKRWLETIIPAIIGVFRPEITTLADKAAEQIPEDHMLRSKGVDRLVGVTSELVREKGHGLGPTGSALSKLVASFLERLRLYKSPEANKSRDGENA